MQVSEDDLNFLQKPVDMTPQEQARLINGAEFPWAFGPDTSVGNMIDHRKDYVRAVDQLDVAAPVLAHTLKWYLSNVASAMAKRHGLPWPGGTTGTTLSIRSGNLINSIKQSGGWMAAL